jgi:hypothetical protein
MNNYKAGQLFILTKVKKCIDLKGNIVCKLGDILKLKESYDSYTPWLVNIKTGQGFSNNLYID